MRYRNAIVAGGLLLLATAPAGAMQRSGSLGLGVEVGEQNGVTAKYWLNDWQALDAGLGESDGDVSFHADFLAHAFDLLPKPQKGQLEAHAGIGFRQRDDEFGLRTIGGLGYWFEDHPIELFLDAGPVFQFTPDDDVDFTAALGVRFYIGGGK